LTAGELILVAIEDGSVAVVVSWIGGVESDIASIGV